MEQLTLDEFKTIAESICNEFNGDEEINCAQSIWKLVEENSRNTFKNDIERNLVIVRAIAVCEFVNDCTSLIWEQEYDPEIRDWAVENGVSIFRIGQAMGKEFENDIPTYNDENNDLLFESALEDLISKERILVVSFLQDKFSTDHQIMEFIGKHYEQDDENTIDPFSEYYEDEMMTARIPGNVMQFYEWISEGMPRRM